MNNRSLVTRVTALEEKQSPAETVFLWNPSAEQIEKAEEGGKRVMAFRWVEALGT